jgi:cytochrome c553
VVTRQGAIKILDWYSASLRRVAVNASDLTEGERMLIAKAADNVAAAYRIISTGDPQARVETCSWCHRSDGHASWCANNPMHQKP